MKPSYIITQFGEKISRVNLIATVTDKFEGEDQNYATITIDDGSEAIRVKTFKEDVKLLDGIFPGELVLVIGKLKEYNGEIYIIGEIVKKVQDNNYENLRKLEILQKLIEQKSASDEIKKLANELSEEELKNYAKTKYGMDEELLQVVLESKRLEIDYKPKVLEVIEKLDEGNGVEISKLFEMSEIPEQLLERTIDELINAGELFEPKPAVLKRV